MLYNQVNIQQFYGSNRMTRCTDEQHANRGAELHFIIRLNNIT